MSRRASNPGFPSQPPPSAYYPYVAQPPPQHPYPPNIQSQPPYPVYNPTLPHLQQPGAENFVSGGQSGSGLPPPFPDHQYYIQQPQVPFDPTEQYNYPHSIPYQSTPDRASHFSGSPQQPPYVSPAAHVSPYPIHQHLTGTPSSAGTSTQPLPTPHTTAAYTAPPATATVAEDSAALWQQPPPLAAPTLAPPPAPPSPAPPTIKIKFRAPAVSTPVNTTATSVTMVSSRSSRRTSQQSVHVEEEVMVSTTGRPQRTVRRAAVQYRVDDDDEDEFDDAVGEDDADGEDDGAMYEADPAPVVVPQTTRSGRAHKAPNRFEDDFGHPLPSSTVSPEARGGRTTRGRVKRVIVDPDEDEEDEPAPPARNPFPSRSTRNSLVTAPTAAVADDPGPSYTNGTANPALRSSRRVATRARHSSADGEDFEPTEDGSLSEDGDHPSSDPLGNYDEEPELDLDDDSDVPYGKRRNTRSRATRSQARAAAPRRSARSAAKRHDSDDSFDGGPSKPNLRARTSRVDYRIPTLEEVEKSRELQDAIAEASKPSRRSGGGVRFGGAASRLPFSMKGDRAQAMGDPDTSDSDEFTSPLKSGAAGPSLSNSGLVNRGTGGPSDVPNYGRVNPKSTMADADPLGVDMNVTFDNVGGLDDHINQLKEMVALPLLYPEVFQQFGITPPRGVLFHGPPGTGKTLLARALSASCSTGNTKISFFMRKGADVLSKWVGEAERQLRMLFEEARAAQPSIIFFDEIDGLAPVRSSKQDQIHASLVSTLLALMDGMDGRGQVIVIGATNRPDAVDPALRRPGRFDREFYFPLPNRIARKKIIGINTRAWEPKLSDEFLDKLAVLTKGYGGADLRALCTEAALNAIQRRYPQIYKTTDRLELQTQSIHVQAKDFMMSIKKIVPSSARSTSSAAVQLPGHLVPLLQAPLDRLKGAIDNVLPPKKQVTALEEAEFEDEDSDNFDKHMMLQALDKLRTFRPRIIVHGELGMGQAYLGPAVLHHLEGFHVQSLDLGTLLGDSNRSVEAAIVQLFVEAKRHQPSVIFVPSLSQWAATVSDTARSTVGALLDSIPPSDPILLLGVADGPVNELPGDVQSWFGFAPENRIELTLPTSTERSAYFADLVAAVRKPPTEFPDGVPRRKRVLEILPLAAPLPARMPTEAELAREEEKDQAARNMMVVSFTNLVQEFIRRFRKVAGSVRDEAMELSQRLADEAAANANPPPRAENLLALVNGENGMEVDSVAILTEPSAHAPLASDEPSQAPAEPAAELSPPAPPAPTWRAHDVDIDTLQRKLIRHKYFTPGDFLADVEKIEENARMLSDPDKLAKIVDMVANARLHVSGFDPKWTPEFERYGERMRARKAERQKRKEQAGNGEEAAVDKKEKDVLVEALAEGEKEKDVDGEVTATGAAGSTENAEDVAAAGKRAREGTEGAEDAQGREKRARDDEPMTVDPAPATAPADPGPEPSAAESATVPPPQAPVPVEHPPFVIPEGDLSLLQAELEKETSLLNIDQLEQLRATLFDKLWRSRTEWDRTHAVEDMRKRIGEFVGEINRWRERGGW